MRAHGGPDLTIDEIHAVHLVAIAAAVLSILGDVEPTGTRVADVVLVGGAFWAAVWASATSPSWLLVTWAGALGVVGFDAPPAVWGSLLGTCVLLAALDLTGRAGPVVHAAAAGTVALASTGLSEVGAFGVSSAIGIGSAAVVVAVGVRARPRSTRRRVRYAIIWGVELSVIFVAAATATMVRARDGVADGERWLRAALEGFEAGDIPRAREALDHATTVLDEIDRDLRRPWAPLGLAVPVAAQHQRLVLDVAHDARSAVHILDDVIDRFDSGAMSLQRGGVDLKGLRETSGSLDELARTVDRLHGTVGVDRSGWLIPMVDERLDDMAMEFGEQAGRVSDLADTSAALGPMLGETEARRYFVAFLTPAEARPLGGYMGNFATVVADAGTVRLERFGRTGDLLAESLDPDDRVLDGPPEYLDRYGPFGAGDGVEPATKFWWQRFTISPEFAHVGEVIAQMYPVSGGAPIDGAISMDPHALAAMLELTGPIFVPSVGRTLDSTNAAAFLEREQYELVVEIGNEGRAEVLDEVARLTVAALLDGRALDPFDIVRALGPEVAGGHLKVWSAHDTEQHLLTNIGVTGTFRRSDRWDALTVLNINSGGNKMDAFLERRITYRAVVDESTSTMRAHVEVTLANTGDAAVLPPYVILNSAGEPPGSNGTYTSLYSALDVESMTENGVAVEPARGQELGWNYAERRVLVPAGGEATLTYELTGAAPPGDYALRLFAQPVVNLDQLDIRVTTAAGETLVAYIGPLEKSMLLRAPE